jgi:hypothetical protein
MASIKSILPFWRRPFFDREEAAAKAKPDDFGKASSYELQFDRLMDDPLAERDTLFSMRSCRH